MLKELQTLKRKIKYHTLAMMSLEASVDKLILNYEQSSEIQKNDIDIEVKQLLEIIKMQMYIDPKDLLGKKRYRELVEARYIVFKI